MQRASSYLIFSLGVCCAMASLKGAETAKPAGTSNMAVQLGHPLTLETGSDDGFLVCAEQVLSPNFKHSNNNDVFSNLAHSPDPSAVAVIVGHGDAGFECTGLGNHCGGGPMLASGNDSVWASLARGIASSFHEVDLLGCNVGAERRGAELLYKLANSVKVPVAAPTTLVWCGGGKVWVDPPAIWQKATPGQMPAVIHKPRVTVPPQTLLHFRGGKGMIDVAISEVRVEDLQLFGTAGSRPFKFGGSIGREMVGLIDFEHPLEPGGVPSAVATGKLSLQVNHRGSVIEKRFIIYNDEIAQDEDNHMTFYRIDSRLSERLRNSR